MDNLHRSFHDKSYFDLWFLNDLMRLWTLKLKVLFPPTTPTQTLLSSISATFSSDSAAFSSPTLFLSMFQGWEVLYNECAGKTKEVLLHFGVFVIPRAWQCHTAPFCDSKGSSRITYQHQMCGTRHRLTRFISEMDGRTRPPTNQGCYHTNKAEFSSLCEDISTFL